MGVRPAQEDENHAKQIRSVLYQGTTSVVPIRHAQGWAFSPCWGRRQGLKESA
jgi:hypothetical protein